MCIISRSSIRILKGWLNIAALCCGAIELISVACAVRLLRVLLVRASHLHHCCRVHSGRLLFALVGVAPEFRLCCILARPSANSATSHGY